MTPDAGGMASGACSFAALTAFDIAMECAAFALCNADDPDMVGFLNPEAIWQGWHDQQEIPAPPMHVAFPDLYLSFCNLEGGARLVGLVKGKC